MCLIAFADMIIKRCTNFNEIKIFLFWTEETKDRLN